MKKYLAIALVMTASMAINARDQINVVGSSTVYPFTTTVAEQFGRQGKFKTPKIESTGTGGGIKLFCNGVGPQHADAVNASRPMKKSEFDTCAKNGVGEILEIKIGYDGLTIAENKKGPLSALTRKEVYLALAKTVPGPNGTMIPNPYRTWQDINPKLPAVKIEVLGPPPTSGTRDSFHELYMEPGCDLENKKACHAIREDGVYVEAGENDNLIAQKLNTNVNALGIFGYSFLEENKARLKGLRIEGVEPNLDTISDGSFPASRPLYVYFKKAHVGTIPGLREFAEEYVSTRALGEDGYLPERGLVPLDAKELAAVRKNVVNLVNFKAK